MASITTALFKLISSLGIDHCMFMAHHVKINAVLKNIIM